MTGPKGESQKDEIRVQIEALIDRSKELQLYLQPVVYFIDRKAFGYEVLSRGARKTELEELSPFIFAGNYSLGQELDRVALQTIISNLGNLPKANLFVNCFLSNLEFLYDLLKDGHFEHRIIVEIDFCTELVDIKKTLVDISLIRSLSFVSFAIDDLGKYSLDRKLYDLIRPAFLKVDICLTKGISEDVIRQKVLDDIVRLSNEIDSQLILEGVDGKGLTDLDRRYLKTIIEFYDCGPVGIEAIAATLQEESDTLVDFVEPYLLKIGMLIRTSSGRKASDAARRHIRIEKQIT